MDRSRARAVTPSTRCWPQSLSQEGLRHQALARHLVFELQKRDVSRIDSLGQRMGLTAD